jgi:hypothetical protein
VVLEMDEMIVGLIEIEMKKYYTESRRRGIPSNNKKKEA